MALGTGRKLLCAVVVVLVGSSLDACSLRDFDQLQAGLSDTSDTDKPTFNRPSANDSGWYAPAPPNRGDAGVSSGSSSEPVRVALVDAGPLFEPGPGNLIDNWGFEQTVAPWEVLGNPRLIRTIAVSHTGLFSLQVAQRTENWEGVAYSLRSRIAVGTNYEAAGWVRVSEGSHEVKISTKTTCNGEDNYEPVGAGTVAQDWVEVRGYFAVTDCADGFWIYFEGPDPGIDLYVDDVTVVPGGN